MSTPSRLRAVLREHRRAGLVLTAVFAILLVMEASSPMPAVHGDGYYTYLWARTFVYDHDADFKNDFALCGDPGGFGDLPVGKNVNLWNLGPALFWVPILAVDRYVHPARNDLDPKVAAGCRGVLPERAVRGSTVAGMLTILLGYLTARKRFGEGAALFGASVIGLATLLTYYTTMMLSYGHAASSFAGALFLFLWDGARPQRSVVRWLLLGGALGLALLMRSQNIVLVVLPLYDWLLTAAPLAKRAREPTNRRKLLIHVAAGTLFAAAALLVFSPQLFFIKKVSGHWFTVLQSESFMRWGTPNMARALFSAGNGLYPWNPILYPATLGLFLLLRQPRLRSLGGALLVVFALDVYVVSCAWDWWGSTGYPGRRFDLMIAPMMVGLAAFGQAFVARARRRPRFALKLLVACTVAVTVQATFGVQYGLAKAMRTDLARASPESWKDSFGYSAGTFWSWAGNPLTWPASLPFALKWGVHPRRWDVLGGPELFYHEERSLQRRSGEAVVWFDNAQHADYLDDFRRPVEMLYEMRVRYAGVGRARMLVPLHYPDAGAFVFRVACPTDATAASTMTLEVNGVALPAQSVLPGAPRELRFDLAPGISRHGINELFVVVAEGDIGFQKMEILDRTPAPEDAQRARDEVRRRLRPQ